MYQRWIAILLNYDHYCVTADALGHSWSLTVALFGAVFDVDVPHVGTSDSEGAVADLFTEHRDDFNTRFLGLLLVVEVLLILFVGAKIGRLQRTEVRRVVSTLVFALQV